MPRRRPSPPSARAHPDRNPCASPPRAWCCRSPRPCATDAFATATRIALPRSQACGRGPRCSYGRASTPRRFQPRSRPPRQDRQRQIWERMPSPPQCRPRWLCEGRPWIWSPRSIPRSREGHKRPRSVASIMKRACCAGSSLKMPVNWVVMVATLGFFTPRITPASRSTACGSAAIGAEVNLAARLQSIAEPGHIVISYDTKALIRDIVAARALPPISVKGVGRMVVPYVVEGVLDDAGRKIEIFSEHITGLDFYLDPRAIDATALERIRATLRNAIAALETRGGEDVPAGVAHLDQKSSPSKVSGSL